MEQKIIKNYRVKENAYKNAMKRAKEENTYLSNIVERVVSAYGNNAEINITFTEAGSKRYMKKTL